MRSRFQDRESIQRQLEANFKQNHIRCSATVDVQGCSWYNMESQWLSKLMFNGACVHARGTDSRVYCCLLAVARVTEEGICLMLMCWALLGPGIREMLRQRSEPSE